MINNKKELEDYIEADRKANLGNKRLSAEVRFRQSFPYRAFCYMKAVRKLEYYLSKRDASGNFFSAFFYSQLVKIHDRKKNLRGERVGLEIPAGNIESGIRIAHPNVILNGYVGKNCVFHGNNVLGNKRTGDKHSVPHLGNNVDVGVGAMIIGNVSIADDCTIGAGAVVTKSFDVPGSVIAGVPAVCINGKKR